MTILKIVYVEGRHCSSCSSRNSSVGYSNRNRAICCRSRCRASLGRYCSSSGKVISSSNRTWAKNKPFVIVRTLFVEELLPHRVNG